MTKFAEICSSRVEFLFPPKIKMSEKVYLKLPNEDAVERADRALYLSSLHLIFSSDTRNDFHKVIESVSAT